MLHHSIRSRRNSHSFLDIIHEWTYWKSLVKKFQENDGDVRFLDFHRRSNIIVFGIPNASTVVSSSYDSTPTSMMTLSSSWEKSRRTVMTHQEISSLFVYIYPSFMLHSQMKIFRHRITPSKKKKKRHVSNIEMDSTMWKATNFVGNEASIWSNCFRVKYSLICLRRTISNFSCWIFHGWIPIFDTSIFFLQINIQCT